MLQKILSFFRKKRPKIERVALEGSQHDLKEIFARLNTRYFENQLDLPISWFGNGNLMPRSSIRLGSYNLRSKTIKVHRLLDQAHIPPFFVSFIVYHEMLHHLLPPIKANKRRSIHHPEFTRREKEFEEYALAVEFIKNIRTKLFIKKQIKKTS